MIDTDTIPQQQDLADDSGVVWTPADVKRELKLRSTREAFSMMRKAGARPAERCGRSLRITKRKMLAWLDEAKARS